ncbi:hypothetical protein SLEP1_g56992 [Rubroshorea leprosula]|uniref:Uncharacterized protein n=1 Tax=Rubroshorea leprosula TaxID=152421 RepID=A0AAV5MMA4_9ROSI|nr:hypothetical protein SLEP1_g56992 [Rubroshorea leprosula]
MSGAWATGVATRLIGTRAWIASDKESTIAWIAGAICSLDCGGCRVSEADTTRKPPRYGCFHSGSPYGHYAMAVIAP